MARRDLETGVAQSSRATEDADRLRQGANAATAELEQERSKSAALARNLESAQRHDCSRFDDGAPCRQPDRADERGLAEGTPAQPPLTGETNQSGKGQIDGMAIALLAQRSLCSGVALKRTDEWVERLTLYHWSLRRRTKWIELKKSGECGHSWRCSHQ